jgi:UDPglucose 6-dehydrogenase
MKIGFIGLSHLGLVYSLATAAKGFKVIAYTTDELLAARCNLGDMPIEEPGFKELFNTYSHSINYTSKTEELKECELIFYSLDIQTNEKNESDTSPLTNLIYLTISSLNPNATVVIISQIPPGYTRKIILELSKNHSFNIGSFYYQVETLIFGMAVQRAIEPERYIVGSNDPELPLTSSFSSWHVAFKCPVIIMRYESAELTKIAINLFLVSSITTTNTLAEVCEAIGADWKDIAPALRLDKRIGPDAYLRPGLGLAGGNLERDITTIKNISAIYGIDNSVILAWQFNSVYRRNWVIRFIHRDLLTKKTDPTIAIWGIAYKENTNSTKNSASIELMQAFPTLRIHAHDPIAKLPNVGFSHVDIFSDPLEAIIGADVLLLMTPWIQYTYIDESTIKKILKGRLVLDPYGILNQNRCNHAGLDYYSLGC